MRDGLVAVAVQNVDGGEAGLVALYDGDGTLIKTITVGVLPDQVTFSPDGNLLLVANEAERFLDRSGPTPVVEDAPGTITIIDVSGDPAAAAVRNTIGFSALDGDEAALDALGLKTYDGGTLETDEGDIVVPDSTVSQDIEPEYITVSPDGTRAYVTLQEVNAIAVIDLTDPTADRPLSILPAGAVDFSLAGNEADFSDRDGAGGTASISVGNAPVKGLLQPDAIASFAVAGVTYFVTANEGDSRILQDAALDDPALNEARASSLQPGASADYARVNVDTVGRPRPTFIPSAAAVSRSSSRTPTAPSSRSRRPAATSSRSWRRCPMPPPCSTARMAAASTLAPTTRGRNPRALPSAPSTARLMCSSSWSASAA